MKTSAILASVALLLQGKLGQASPVEVDARQAGNCLVNRLHIDTWHENAQSRRRVAASSENTPVENYCKYWQGDMNIRNVQCYYNDVVGSYVIDVNTDLGPLGDQVFSDRYGSSLDDWRFEYHCATG